MANAKDLPSQQSSYIQSAFYNAVNARIGIDGREFSVRDIEKIEIMPPDLDYRKEPLREIWIDYKDISKRSGLNPEGHVRECLGVTEKNSDVAQLVRNKAEDTGIPLLDI